MFLVFYFRNSKACQRCCPSVRGSRDRHLQRCAAPRSWAQKLWITRGRTAILNNNLPNSHFRIFHLTMARDVDSLPYHEPGIVVILIQTSFLLFLNVVNAALDRIFYCGLLGQILVGIAWGTPGAGWLSASVEETVVQWGYLGLILLVYEGSLACSTCDFNI